MDVSNLEKITLPNRDRASLYLIQLSEGSLLYRLECDKEHNYVLKYGCITMNEDNQTIYAFDPSGGPFLCIGYKVCNNRTIKSIFEFEDDIIFEISPEFS